MTSVVDSATVNGDTTASTDSSVLSNIPRDYRPDSRVEPIPKPDFPHQLYPRWIGHKFKPSGPVLPYPGNTVLAHLHPDSPLHHALQAFHKDLREQDFAYLLTILPPSSWHMTIYEGITDEIRIRNSYPGELSLDSSLKTCHAHVAGRLAEFETGLKSGRVGQMTIVGFEPLDDGIGLKLEPATSDGEKALRKLRDRLSDRLKMRHPGHDGYSWHMGLAYSLRHLAPEDEAKLKKYLAPWQERLPRIFDLGTPEFCTYDNMYQFRRVFFLE